MLRRPSCALALIFLLPVRTNCTTASILDCSKTPQAKETSSNCWPLSLVRKIYPQNMKRLVGLTVLALLTGCTSVSEVTPAGDGRYTVTTQVRGGMTPWGEVKASSLKRADDYCRKQGMQMHQVDMQTHGVRGWTPQEAELTFACLGGQ
ncbi:conserved exported hypothetical protein [Paraburkholderia caribensis]|nr:conserved exported hypothetical protein [Paraburkholderia caribensis]